MTLDHTIAFVGAGNMAGALIRGLAEKQTIRRDRIVAADPDPTRLDALGSELGIRTTADNAEAVAGSSVVLIATKPQVLPDALRELADALPGDALVISIAAGISTSLIERLLSGDRRVVTEPTEHCGGRRTVVRRRRFLGRRPSRLYPTAPASCSVVSTREPR